jgi:hypothetical protein
LTLQRGIDETPDRGVLQVLDAGAYGVGTITRSITISGDGVSAIAGRITVNSATAKVVLRGLMLVGPGPGGFSPAGINILAARSVHVVRCEIDQFANYGIALISANTELFVMDSIARNNRSSGLYVSENATGSKLTVDNSRFVDNASNGISVNKINSTITRTVASGNATNGIFQNGGRMDVSWTTASHNGENGILVTGGANMTASFTMASHNAEAGYGSMDSRPRFESSTSQFNKTGLLVSNGGAVISNSMFYDSSVDITTQGGVVYTRLNNTVRSFLSSSSIITLSPQ